MYTVFIIGASQSLGLEWVKYYKNLGYNVIATTRNIKNKSELNTLLGPNDQLLQLDVTNIDSVTAAINMLNETPDISIYNAGVKGYTIQTGIRSTISNAQLINKDSFNNTMSSRENGINIAFQVNTYGFDRIMYALKEQLLHKHQAVVLYISTGVANTSQNTSGGYPFYRESKVAGEALVRSWYIECLAQSNADSCPRIFSIIPGLVNIGMGKNLLNAAKPAQRIAEMAKVIEQVKHSGDTHGVWKYDGTKYSIYEVPLLNTD